MLSSCVKSKFESKVRDRVFVAPVAAPAGLIALAEPESLRIPKPGLLSTICSPGYKSIVVLSTKSVSYTHLTLPTTTPV